MNERILDDARAFLRGHLAGELQFEEHLRPVKIVIAPDGRPVGAVMVAMLEAPDTVLFLPYADEDSMQIQVTLERFEERGEGGAFADRWRIYHGEPDDVNWAYFYIDAVKFQGAIIDGEALMTENPVAREEPRLCREVNEGHREELRGVVQRHLDLDLEDPRLVGIDPYGVDIRGPFDILRIPFDEPHPAPRDAEAALHRLLAGESD